MGIRKSHDKSLYLAMTVGYEQACLRLRKQARFSNALSIVFRQLIYRIEVPDKDPCAHDGARVIHNASLEDGSLFGWNNLRHVVVGASRNRAATPR